VSSEWDGEKVWAQVFHPEVAAALKAAEDILAKATLDYLDNTLEPMQCDVGHCGLHAAVAVLCRHNGALVAVLCSIHADPITRRIKPTHCRACHRTLTPERLWQITPIFTSRSRP
jgi:hypothetical protein